MNLPPSISLTQLNDPELDASHEELARLVLALAKAEDGATASSLEALVRHAATHFGDEDRDLRMLEGNAHECHLDEHAAVLKSIGEVRALEAPDRSRVARMLAHELALWLPRHIAEMDLQLAQSLFMRRTGGARVGVQRASAPTESLSPRST